MTTVTEWRRTFATLPAPAVSELPGHHRGEFVGPAWLRRSAPIALALGGLGGWWGKCIDAHGGAINLVQRGGALQPTLAMTIQEGRSRLDDKPCVVLGYPKNARWPWPWIVDEARRLDAQTLLCMTGVRLRPFPTLALPFLLHHTLNPPARI